MYTSEGMHRNLAYGTLTKTNTLNSLWIIICFFKPEPFMASIKTVRHPRLLPPSVLLSLQPAIKPLQKKILETSRKPVKELWGFCFASISMHLPQLNGNLLTYQTEVGCLVSCVMAIGFVTSSGPFNQKIFVMEET